jgi:hypothetical protein
MLYIYTFVIIGVLLLVFPKIRGFFPRTHVPLELCHESILLDKPTIEVTALPDRPIQAWPCALDKSGNPKKFGFLTQNGQVLTAKLVSYNQKTETVKLSRHHSKPFGRHYPRLH